MKTINYLKRNNYLKDYKESIPDENSPMFHCAKIFKTLDDEKTKYLINTLKNSVLLSLYFNQYKYLLNLLSFEEIKNLYENELNIETFRKREEKTISVTKELVEKILEKESILELKEELIEIQKYYILFLFFTLTMIKKKEFIKYYQSINFLRDFSFCSKMYIYYNFVKLNNKSYNFIEDLYPPLIADRRCFNFFDHIGNEDEIPKELGEENINIINNALSIKDFLIIENKQFQEEIKTIENDLKINSIKYLKLEEISNYIRDKNIKDNRQKK